MDIMPKLGRLMRVFLDKKTAVLPLLSVVLRTQCASLKKRTFVVDKSAFFAGAGGRGRTGTGFIPLDFESSTSANSITPALIFFNFVSIADNFVLVKTFLSYKSVFEYISDKQSHK